MIAGSAKLLDIRGPKTEPKADLDDPVASHEGSGSGAGAGAGAGAGWRLTMEPRLEMADEARRYVGIATIANKRDPLKRTENERGRGE